MVNFIIPQNSPFLNEKSRHRETPAASKLPAFLCACFLVKGLGEFEPTDEADEDLFFGEDGYSFNHSVYQGVGILRSLPDYLNRKETSLWKKPLLTSARLQIRLPAF